MKVAEAILLFLKGEGHFTNISPIEIAQKRSKAVAHQLDMLGMFLLSHILIDYLIIFKN